METHKQDPAEAIKAAESAIRAVVGKLIGISDVAKADNEDIAQTLRMHVARKAAAYDPGRSSLPTFLDRIIKNRVKDFLDEYFAECRDPRKLDHLPESPEGDDGGFNEQVDQEDALRRAGMLPWPADAALVIDVKLVLEQLTEIDRLTCEALSVTKSLREAAKTLGIHVETLRQRVAKIRALFEAWGITGA